MIRPENCRIAEWEGTRTPVELHADGKVSTLDFPLSRCGTPKPGVTIRPPKNKAERAMIAQALALRPTLNRTTTINGTTVTWQNFVGGYAGQHGTFDMTNDDAAKEMANFCKRGESLASADIPPDLAAKIVRREG